MSYLTKDYFNKMKGSSVLFIDIETTGLPNEKKYFEVKPEDRFPDVKNNDGYNNCRLVSIAWYYSKKFNFEDINLENIEHVIRKPSKTDKFDIKGTQYHGLTKECIDKNGIFLGKIVNTLKKYIKLADYIVAYNAFFDIYVLQNELWRINFNNTFSNIQKHIDNKTVICVGRLSALKYPEIIKYKYYKYQIPSLNNIYKHLFGKNIDNAHNANVDVYSMIQVLNKMGKDIINSESDTDEDDI